MTPRYDVPSKLPSGDPTLSLSVGGNGTVLAPAPIGLPGRVGLPARAAEKVLDGH
jgi:hypothetical protein